MCIESTEVQRRPRQRETHTHTHSDIANKRKEEGETEVIRGKNIYIMLILLSYLQGLNEVMAALHFGFVVGHERRLHLRLPRERWEALERGEEEKTEKRRRRCYDPSKLPPLLSFSFQTLIFIYID
jgi:hypothetical protein